MDHCSTLIEYLGVGARTKCTNEPPENVRDPNFISFFVSYIHTAASKLCELKTSATSPPANKQAYNGHNNSQSKTLSSTKSSSHDRISTPKQQRDGFSPSRTAKTMEAVMGSNKRNRRSRGKSPLVKQSEPVVPCRQYVKSDGQQKRVALTEILGKSSLPKYDLSNASDFPTLGNEAPAAIKPILSDHQQVSRRIKPTLVTKRASERCQLFSVDKSTSDSNNKFTGANAKLDLQQERKKLLQTRIFSVEKSLPAVESLQIGDALEKELQFISPIKTENDLTTPPQNIPTLQHKKELERLAELYVYYITSSSVASVVAEIHLLVALHAVEGNGECTLPTEFLPINTFLSTCVNARFFAATSLCQLATRNLFSLFSDETLSLLQANALSKGDFAPLNGLLSKEITAREKSKQRLNSSIVNSFSNLGSVPFKAETDDKTNFASEKSFHGFRKQRDMFYSLMREWHESHDLNASTAPKETIGKIRWLVTQVKTLSTYSAFLRLFVDHLLNVGTEKEIHETTDLNNSALRAILGNDPEKRRRLESRVSTPAQPNTSHEWLFKDFQFFRDFLTIADNYSLNVRLCDTLRKRISEIESQNALVDENCLEHIDSESCRISQVVFGLRICANFYGYITFLPYKKDDKDELSHIESSASSFVKISLKKALENGHLFITVPWVIQFLCFAPSSLLVDGNMADILHTLCAIVRSNNPYLSSQPSMFKLFLSVVVGYLFEQETVNNDIYYKSTQMTAAETSVVPSNCIDSIASDLLNHDFLYEMHWKLTDINSLLKSRSTSLCSRQLPKKIKPSTEKLPEHSNLQTTLEANFFRNQSLSLKRTVSFVAERCHSNCVKQICTKIIPEYCENSEPIQKLVSEGQESKEIINSIVVNMFEDASKSIRNCAFTFNSENIIQCMQLLVSSTVPPKVLQTASNIAERQSKETITSWIREKLFDLLVSRIKLLQISKKKTAGPSINYGQVKLSTILHELRETIIQNQKADLEGQPKCIENTVNCIKSACGPLHELYDVLPLNIKQSFCFLLCQLLMQITKSPLEELPCNFLTSTFTASEILVLDKCAADSQAKKEGSALSAAALCSDLTNFMKAFKSNCSIERQAPILDFCSPDVQ